MAKGAAGGGETIAAPVSEADQLYQLGRQTEASNSTRAFEYYRLAANLGQVDAELRAGLLLIADNKAEQGIAFIKEASAAGNPRASYVVGLAMLNGIGVTKDPIKDRLLLTQARELGLAAAGQALSAVGR